jgi:hypothetical protein
LAAIDVLSPAQFLSLTWASCANPVKRRCSANSATSNFNSLQVSLNRQFSTGLSVGLAYTYSKALGVASDDGGYTRIDNLTRFANYGPLNFDRRQVIAINYIYDFLSFSEGKMPSFTQRWMAGRFRV